MYKALGLTVVLLSALASWPAWAEDEDDFGSEEDTEMSSEVDADNPDFAPDTADEEASPEDASAATDEVSSAAPDAQSTTSAAPTEGNAFNLDDGNQPGDGPPAVLIDEKPQRN